MYNYYIIESKIVEVLKIVFKFFSSSCGKYKKNRLVKKAPKPAIDWLCNIQIQKEVISNQKQPSCKKGAAAKKAMVKKDVKSKVAAKKWL